MQQQHEEVWLLKVPEFLGERWQAACQAAESAGPSATVPDLGSIQVTDAATQGEPSDKRIRLTLAGGASQDLPQVYNLREVADDVRDMAAISEVPGRPPELSGAISRRLNAEIDRSDPAAKGLDPAYRALSRQRHQLADTHTRVLKRVEPGEVAQAHKFQLREPTAIKSARELKQQMRDKRDNKVRLEPKALERLLFQVFEEKQYWKLQELRQRTQQPDSAIKAALAGVAELVKRGEHRGKYQLKPEYQQG